MARHSPAASSWTVTVAVSNALFRRLQRSSAGQTENSNESFCFKEKKKCQHSQTRVGVSFGVRKCGTKIDCCRIAGGGVFFVWLFAKLRDLFLLSCFFSSRAASLAFPPTTLAPKLISWACRCAQHQSSLAVSRATVSNESYADGFAIIPSLGHHTHDPLSIPRIGRR